MFNSISWQQFFYTVLAVLGIYYSVSIFFFYARDIVRIFSHKTQLPQDSFRPEGESSHLMGVIKNDSPKKNERSVDAQDLVVDQAEAKKHDNEESLLIGSVSDLLHDIKVLTLAIKESNGTKEDGAPMVQALLSNYPHIAGTKYQESVSLFIYEHFRNYNVFDAELNEIISWWPQTESQSN